MDWKKVSFFGGGGGNSEMLRLVGIWKGLAKMVHFGICHAFFATFQVSSSKHTLTLPHPTPPTPPISSTHTHPPISSNHKQTQNETTTIYSDFDLCYLSFEWYCKGPGGHEGQEEQGW